MVGLFGLGLGAIVRNTAGGIAAFAAIMFVLPPLMNVLPASWNNAISRTCRATPAPSHGAHPAARPRARGGFALFCAYTALAIAVAAVLLVRRDA